MSISKPETPGAAHDIGCILHRDSKRLDAALNHEPGTARIEVQCLLQSVLQVNRAYLLTHLERILSDDETAHYNALFQRRINGEPIAYLLGTREFYGLEFKVTPATLIPRPDTELLVELALQRIPQRGKCRILDMGTGSGAIALAIAHERADAEVVAVDASDAALDVARENAQRLNLGNVRLLHSDWFASLEGERFDIIVSNPPYIESDDVHLGQGDVRFEPLSALASGSDGLDDIRRIVANAKKHLTPAGWLMFEHGYDQADRVRQLLQDAGFSGVASWRDLSGIERVTIGQA
ncbi:MAG: peptide chain release factor N(5)-glutamine methyltransferase [Proteobacteria bacterium]|nr:peptide chain release factor N(5)-glutamine methyltransferase [Pseudomonadota bacterium]